MSVARPYFITPAFAFVAYPNRNSVPFREFYNITEAETVVRGTLRYQGFPEFVRALVALGWLNMEKKPWLKEGMTWAEVFQQSIGAADASERYVPPRSLTRHSPPLTYMCLLARSSRASGRPPRAVHRCHCP